MCRETWAFSYPRVLGRLRRASKGDPILRLYTPHRWLDFLHQRLVCRL